MAQKTIAIDKYAVDLMSSYYPDWRAIVYLMNQNKLVARLEFYDVGKTQGLEMKEHGAAEAKIPYIYYPFRSYAAFVDLLRNEQPLWLTYAADPGYEYARLGCGAEPVGEGEDAT